MNEKPIIILDVDETLISTKLFKENNKILLTEINDNNMNYYIYMRPFLKEFIININNYFDIYIYSLGTIDYINIVLENIAKLIGFFPFKKVIANQNDNKFTSKTLDIFNFDIDLNKVIIIDDRYDVWYRNLNNLYNIKKYDNALELKNNYHYFLEILKKLKKDNLTYEYNNNNNYVKLYDIFNNNNESLFMEDNELYKLNEIINKYFELYDNFNINIFKNMINKINFEYIINII
jgi:TFIIF-interacting CTD phosphatase-like protein